MLFLTFIGRLCALKTKPRKYQIAAFNKAIKKKSFAFIMDPGTGKTLIALWYAAHKHLRGKVKTVLIVGPKVSERVWASQIREHLNVKFRRVKWGQSPTQGVLNFYFMTPQAAIRRAPQVESLSPDLIIVDESHCLKSPVSKQSKIIGRFESQYKLMLTGTPIDKDPLDFWAQWRFCKPDLYDDDWKWFRENWCKKEPVYSGGRPVPYVFNYSIHPAVEKEYLQRMEPYTFVAKNEELPRFNRVIHEVQLSPTGQRLYNELQQDSIAEFEDEAMVSDSPFSLITRLHQLASGIFVDDETDNHKFVDSAKIKAAIALIDTHKEPAVVFCKYLDDMNRLYKLLRHNYTVKRIYGAHKDNPKSKWDVMLVQIQSGGMSIDLTRARHMYFISLPYSYIQYYQAIKRCHRPPQDKPVTAWIIEAKTTIDKEIRDVIQRKSSVTKAILTSLNKRKS